MSPQTMAMTASVVNAAAVNPAASCPPAPPALADRMSATAPMPSASVDNPTIVVRLPQMMNSTPRNSTWEAISIRNQGSAQGLGLRDQESRANRNSKLDSHGRRVRGAYAEAEPRAIGDTGRHGNADRMMKERLAGPTAWIAGSNPCLAAAAASAARATQRHIER